MHPSSNAASLAGCTIEQMNRRSFLGLTVAALASCRKSSKIQLALNWKPDPQFGGFYAAPYSEYDGTDVDILPGGAGTPTIQMIGAGSAQFGIVSADELVLARARGNRAVALFAVFQNCPQGIMVHASRHLTSIGDVVKDGTLAIQRGLPYARILEKRYGFDHVRVVPSPGGDITSFLSDEKFAQQCFIMDEPISARHKGVEITVFPVADLGYNPYTTVVAVSEDYLRNNMETAKSMTDAVRDGWRAYLDHPQPINDRMHQLNPSMDLATFAEVADAQKPYIETAQLGSMTEQRWKELIDQLHDLGDIPESINVSDCFRNLT